MKEFQKSELVTLYISINHIYKQNLLCTHPALLYIKYERFTIVWINLREIFVIKARVALCLMSMLTLSELTCSKYTTIIKYSCLTKQRKSDVNKTRRGLCIYVILFQLCRLCFVLGIDFHRWTSFKIATYSLLYPPQTKFGGYIGITLSVCLSVCPSVCPSVRPSVRLSVQSKLNFDHNFLAKGDRALILHKRIPCDKTCLSIPKFLTSWPWPWLLTYFRKNLTLVRTFKTKEVGLSYFTCVFFVARPFCWNQNFWLRHIDLDFWPTFEKNLTLVRTFETKEVGLSYFTCVFLVARPFCWNQNFWLCDIDLDFWPTFEKT